MKQYVILSLVGVLVISGLLLWFGGVELSLRKKAGYLSVETEQDKLLVSFDDSKIGRTPLKKIEVPVGEHFLKIGNNWQEKIRIAESAESKVVRELQDSQNVVGYKVEYEKRRSLFSSTPRLVVNGNGGAIEVFLDQENLGTTPVSREDLSAGKHYLEVKRTGYKGIEFVVRIFKDTLTIVTFDLAFDPTQSIEDLSVPQEKIAESLPDKTIIRRSEWDSPKPDYRNLKLALADWEQLEFKQLLVPKNKLKNTVALLRELEKALRDKYTLPGLPFAYVIDARGKIYEGFGVLDFDFSSVEQLSYTQGSVPVLIVRDTGSKDSELSKLVLEAIGFLRGKLARPEVLDLSLTNSIEQQELQAGARTKVEIKILNKTSAVWVNGKEPKLELVIDSSDASVFYDPESWISKQRVSGFSNQYVLPGQEAKFPLTLKTPHYSGEFGLRFQIKQLNQQTPLLESPVNFTVRVVDGYEKVVVIKETPTGYLNVRVGPGLGYDLVTTVFPGEKFAEVERQAGWVKIILRDGTEGWVLGRYIK